jgi:hypothetical protein
MVVNLQLSEWENDEFFSFYVVVLYLVANKYQEFLSQMSTFPSTKPFNNYIALKDVKFNFLF